MYKFSDKLILVRGLGDKLVRGLAKKNIKTVGDLLTLVPLRYEDRSNLKTIDQLSELTAKTLVTIQANIGKISTQYKAGRYGRQTIQRGTASDDFGKVKLVWFNSPYVVNQIDQNSSYMLSGSFDPKYQALSQPVIERASADTIHTNRLVPIYSATLPIRVGLLRRIIKHITDNLEKQSDQIALMVDGQNLPELVPALSQLHFPDEPDKVVESRRRLALEEFLQLMRLSEQSKKIWQQTRVKPAIREKQHKLIKIIPDSVPFELTEAQKRCVSEIAQDLTESSAMNRLLIGDVGSGKTVVAGLVAHRVLLSGFDVALIAPTKILATQHFETFKTLFPEVNLKILTSQIKSKPTKSRLTTPSQPTLFVGTHSVINQLSQIKPALIIYDEQQRFGVSQRSEALDLEEKPHILTMTATPIPRSLMLTIFSHLNVSHLDEMPPGRQAVKTWLVPKSKQPSGWDWVAEQVEQKADLAGKKNQVFVVCPFIEPSDSPGLERVASAKLIYDQVRQQFKKIKVGLLHGKLPKKQQAEVVEEIYQQNLQILVTTSIVEVGVDLPQASVMIIYNPERFGLASLHQLRGRVGRSGQQGYCLLFAGTKNPDIVKRLKLFSQETDGLKLAELDLENRGSGDLFGTQQTGFSQLTFGSWTDLDLIGLAKKIYPQLPANWQSDILASNIQESNKLVLAN